MLPETVMGDVGLISKKEQMESDAYKTRAQLKAALPNDAGQLKKLASDLMVKDAVLERELDYSKNFRTASWENCQRRSGRG